MEDFSIQKTLVHGILFRMEDSSVLKTMPYG